MGTLIKIREWEDSEYFYTLYQVNWNNMPLQYTIAVRWSTLTAHFVIDEAFTSQFGGIGVKEFMSFDGALDMMNAFKKEVLGTYPIIKK